MIRRDLHRLLTVAGFTLCMALFNGMHSKADPDPQPPQRLAPQPPGESAAPLAEPGPGP